MLDSGTTLRRIHQGAHGATHHCNDHQHELGQGQYVLNPIRNGRSQTDSPATE